VTLMYSTKHTSQLKDGMTFEEQVLAEVRGELEAELPWFHDFTPEQQQALVELSRETLWGDWIASRVLLSPIKDRVLGVVDFVCVLVEAVMSGCYKSTRKLLGAIGIGSEEDYYGIRRS